MMALLGRASRTLMQQPILLTPLRLGHTTFMALMRGAIEAVPDMAIIIDIRVSASRSIAAVLHLVSSKKKRQQFMAICE